MTTNNEYYLIEPGDDLKQIEYLIDIGCIVVCRMKLLRDPDNFLIIYNRFGYSLDMIKFYQIENFNPKSLKPLYVKF